MSRTSAPPRPTAPAAEPPADAPLTPPPSRPSRWAADLALGARFAVAGGWEGWIRTLLTAVGVGLGVAVLLLAASVPTALEARDARVEARGTVPSIATPEDMRPGPSDTTALMREAPTVYHDKTVHGWLLQPDGDHPPVPPGLNDVPDPGEAVVSPALRDLLSSEEGELLRERLPYEIVGTIGDEGLSAPNELVYYAGSDQLAGGEAPGLRITDYGADPTPSEGLDGIQVLLVVVVCVVLLLPVTVFLVTAVRFGSERRDRRLAALRLVGADTRMARRTAAGEALVGTLFGLVLGGVFFFLLRCLSESVALREVTVFATDVRPDPGIALLVLLVVPLAAIGISLLAMRRIVVEPLGVVRRAAPRRRLWWRLLLPALGVLLLLPFLGNINASDDDVATYQIATGMVLLLFGITTVLPWLLDRVVGRLRGGPVPFQLATRRLGLDSEPAVRAVGGITVALAGAIAVQMLFGSVSDRYTENVGPQAQDGVIEVTLGSIDSDRLPEVTDAFQQTPGVRDAFGVVDLLGVEPGDEGSVRQITVADCATLRQLATIDTCRDGQVFLPRESRDGGESPATPGLTMELNTDISEERPPEIWKVPQDAVPVGDVSENWVQMAPDVLATPSAIDASRADGTSIRMRLVSEPDAPEVLEHVRNTAVAYPDSYVADLGAEIVDDDFASIQRALYAGAVGVLLLIGASMIVSTLEQLRERKRQLSVLVAFGTKRATLGASVLWQTAVPVVLGIALAVVFGLGLGWGLLRLLGAPPGTDWLVFVPMAGAGAGVIALVTLSSLPFLWRMMRPDGLRTE